VILCPGPFVQNVLGQASSIKTRMVPPFAKDLPVALIDVRDTDAVGARILIDPAPHAGKTYEFTGKLTTYGAFRRGVLAGARPANRLCRPSRPSRPSRA
jgi:NAD(P)H dehydrogenase (quinone)